MRKFVSVIIIVIATFKGNSQEALQKNNQIFLEGLGSAGHYSLNYQKTLFRGVNYRDFIRVGLGISYDSWTKLGVPNKPFSYYLQYNILIIFGTESGTKKLRYEYGIGTGIAIGEPVRYYGLVNHTNSDRYDFGILGCVGLRYYPHKVPLLFRLTYTPVYDIDEKQLIPIWAGASLGYKF
ncbi:MAG TPA: hypothetical protein VNX68_13575 [Nitrosopumilaceae archaeon]|jgi:hypothetical protein|nr:hypothetical protein [Nitrosopumilaceae archaeon]